MKRWTSHDHFEAPIERVFDLTTDPLRMVEMLPSIDTISEVRGKGDAVGDSFRFRDRVLGRTMIGTTVVTGARRPLLQTTETTYEDGSNVTWTMRFHDAGAGTNVDNEVTYESPPGALSHLRAMIIGPFVEHRLRRSAYLFREMLERDESASGQGTGRPLVPSGR